MPSIKRNKNYIEIHNTIPHNPDFTYDFLIDHLKHDGLENWINHLREKRWWNEELEKELRDIFYKLGLDKK